MRFRLIPLFCLPLFCFSQEQYLASDLESWTSIGLKKKLSDIVTVSLSEQLRLQKNSSQLQQLFTELELDIKPADAFYFGLGYRIASKKDHDDDVWKNGGRYNIDLGTEHKLGSRLKMDYRFRFQRYKQFESNENPSTIPVRAIRLKVSAGYNIPKWKWDPKFSAEIFRDKEESISSWKKMRFTLSTSKKVKKLGKFNAFYRFERTLDTSYPTNYFILGANFTFNL